MIHYDNISKLKYDAAGLIPVIVQDYKTKLILTLAYMNSESLGLTLLEGRTVFWSRSRQELWRKGETSGNIQRVVSVTADCDGDALVVEVERDGPACHLGGDSCFEFPILEQNVERAAEELTVEALYQLIEERRREMPEESYTTYLFEKGREKILKKLGEECAEVIIASMKGSHEETVYELTDLLYHALVLMVNDSVTIEQLKTELNKRHGAKGG